MHAYNNKNHGNKGFTLIELLVTLAILALVAAIGYPNFTHTITRGRLTSHANDLVTSINIARSEAIKRGVQVTIRRTNAQWEGGWTIFVDRDGTEGFVDDGDATLCETTAEGLPAEDCLLKTYPPLQAGYTLRTSGGTTYQNYIAFTPTGVSIAAAVLGDTFRLCDSSADNTISRAIVINAVGRARVSTGTVGCP